MPIFVWFLGKVVVMAKKRVLFISQEIVPYLPESEMANIGRFLPQGIQDKGKEIRTFMPRYGCINERRNQLHEVIRLSGMNLIINDTDHPLIIKVASIQAARMQVYFIDNEDYFPGQRRKIYFLRPGSIRNRAQTKMGPRPDLLPRVVHSAGSPLPEKRIS